MAQTDRLTPLRENLSRYFDLEELRTICFDLGIDWDGLRGEEKTGKVKALLILLDNTGRIPELIKHCARLRPKVAWQVPAPPLEAPEKAESIPPRSADVDVLLVTVTEVEARAVLDVFTPGQAPQRAFVGDNTYFDLGVHGNACVHMVQSEMGSGGLAGSQATVQASIEALHPAAVVMVGIAFGVDSRKQKIGDILISRQLMSYDLQKVATDRAGRPKRIPRGDRVHASVKLVNRFVAGIKDWQGQEAREGLVLSGDKLVDNLWLRQQLLQFEPEAIGGEMEGAGLYAAAQRARVDWILVKAICDWADGDKSRNKAQRQLKAARNAAEFVLHVIRQGGLAGQG